MKAGFLGNLRFEKLAVLIGQIFQYNFHEVFVNVERGLMVFKYLPNAFQFDNPVFKVKVTLESKDPVYLENARGCLLTKLAELSVYPVDGTRAG